jgi:hypothetical protein
VYRAVHVSGSSREREKSGFQHPRRSLLRLRGRGRLLALLEAPVLLTRLDIAPGGRLVPETQDWETFWAPVHGLASQQIDGTLNALHAVWQDYIRSGFDRSLQREYCFRYFILLDLMLSTHKQAQHSSSWEHALRTVVGFECFGLRAPALGTQVLAAGTATLRNPCYLLAKLKLPDALDNTQFLPLIAVGDNASKRLFYHYRQYRLAKDSAMSLLLYLAASPAHRSASFSLVDSLVERISPGGDPRIEQRARRLWERVLKPIIWATYPDPSGPITLEFVDVGAGSGALTAALCRRILTWGAVAGFSSRFRLWFVDLCLADPARFFRAADLRSSIDTLMFLGDDYRGWLARPRPLPSSSDLRVALVSRLFNNLSHFSACPFRTDVLSSLVVGSVILKEGKHLPAYCLAPDCPGPEALMVSNSHVALPQGHTFAQASLSEFYRALRLALTANSGKELSEEEVCLPLRALDPECLITSDGASVLARLLEHCNYLIVEDADLRPKDLVEHLQTFSLHTLTACDMTRTLGLTGNYAYVLWPRDSEAPLRGERLWQPSSRQSGNRQS